MMTDDGGDDDGRPTRTSKAQADTEFLVLRAFASPSAFDAAKTVAFLQSGLRHLDAAFSTLDSSRAWLCYWILHGLALLRVEVDDNVKRDMVAHFTRCQCADGGFGGGPMQLAHTAPTYASVMALVTVGTLDAFKVVNRPLLYRYLLSLKDGEGGFRVHHDGEADSRGMYTVLAVAAMVNVLTPELADGAEDWVKRSQGFDGGVGGEPGNESHGGYAYCALASMVLLGRAHEALDLDAMASWLAQRQMPVEGGFQGRTNKLVDSCYSFWQGACFPLLRLADPDADYAWLDEAALHHYVLGACAHASGGLRDKPGAGRDFYHTCYALSGLSVTMLDGQGTSSGVDLARTDPVFNVEVNKLARAQAFFAGFRCDHDELLEAAARLS